MNVSEKKLRHPKKGYELFQKDPVEKKILETIKVYKHLFFDQLPQKVKDELIFECAANHYWFVDTSPERIIYAMRAIHEIDEPTMEIAGWSRLNFLYEETLNSLRKDHKDFVASKYDHFVDMEVNQIWKDKLGR